ncbi:MAG: hypothetical protein AAF488_19585 [Planctomycetota bacterium]
MSSESRASYRARPTSPFGRGFALLVDEETVANVSEATKGEFGVQVGAARWRIGSAPGFGARFEMTSLGGEVIGIAEKPDAVGPRFQVRFVEGPTVETTPAATYGRKCLLVREEAVIGAVDDNDLTTRDLSVDIAGGWSVEQVAFIVWVAFQALPT